MAFNHKNVEQLGFGSYNGTVGLWDFRVNSHTPSILSEVETSHHEPVVDLIWMSSKGGNEFVSCSTDGKVFWWDSRNLSAPTDSLTISEGPINLSDPSSIIGEFGDSSNLRLHIARVRS